MTRFGLTAPVLIAEALLWFGSASANAITINGQVPPSGVVTLSTGFLPVTGHSGSISPFFVITGSTAAEIGAPGTITALNSDNIDFNSSGPATLFVWIAVNDLTAMEVTPHVQSNCA
jgi:hypothetical protein